MTKWWKCDFQVATPAWNFSIPSGEHFNFDEDEHCERFCDLYMNTIKSRGIEVVALADHNSYEWIDRMKAAGVRHGVHVFPGVEITTGSGADGVHLVLIGDRSKTSRDFDLLLSSILGFDENDHPRFHVINDKRVPGSSPKTITQILDEISNEYIVIAPHALTDNGIAGKAYGDIRWRALHHHRLGAIDPGDCSECEGTSFNNRFRRRDLEDFPCLKTIPFVSTSDAYSLEKLGSRYTWLRMHSPTVEGLRQAFLDREARVLCDWDKRLKEYKNADPNYVRHAWIPTLEMAGLQNSRERLDLHLHPHLNVIIGGRGSGKSTVVAAIRQLYSTIDGLPKAAKAEANMFVQGVFLGAELRATHRLANSQEAQVASWNTTDGALTRHAEQASVSTTFRVRVVNQKELFERASQSFEDKFSASRSFLSFVDEGIGYTRTNQPAADSWWRKLEFASNEWSGAMRDYQLVRRDVGQIPAAKARVQELERQLEAFDSEEAKNRRINIRSRRQEREYLESRVTSLENWLQSLKGAVAGYPPFPDEAQPLSLGELQPSFDALLSELEATYATLKSKVESAVTTTVLAVESIARGQNGWWAASVAAEVDAKAYVADLVSKGIDPKAYGTLQTSLHKQQALLKDLLDCDSKREEIRQRVDVAWNRVQEVLEERRQNRRVLLDEVSGRSGRLMFEVVPHGDTVGWTNEVRDLLNLRSDAFLDDVPSLSHWLWRGDAYEPLEQRWSTWRNALASNDFTSLKSLDFKSGWIKKLQGLDEAVRIRLATVYADDSVEMRFLRDGGDSARADHWQRIEEGSPGQRTAAMLGFVLHHGDEPLVLDQPEDDLDTEWISKLVVKELRASRWKRQLIVVTHNANIPVNGDAVHVIVLENRDRALRVRADEAPSGTRVLHCGAIEVPVVREDIQNIMEGGITAFVQRERKYNNETRRERFPLHVLH